jgi:hypothetical protein
MQGLIRASARLLAMGLALAAVVVLALSAGLATVMALAAGMVASESRLPPTRSRR